MPERSAPQDIVDVAITLAAYLSDHDFDYAFGGALALGFWAAPRGTVDVDLTLYVSHDDPSECASILRDADCELSRTEAMCSLKEHGFCRVRYRGFQLDVFLPTIRFYEDARTRRRRVTINGQPIMIWDAETLCVFKMMFFRLKDLSDVQQIIQVQGNGLDTEWVREQLVEIYGHRDPRVTRWQELVAETRLEGEGQ